MSKILLLDIETSPNTAHVWGIWQQNIAINQLLESSQILCFAAKWLGEKDIVFKSIKNSSYKAMLKSIWKLLDEADAVVHYNGSRFDIPSLNKAFLLEGMFPPSPVIEMDLLKVARNRFRFVSNKLDYIAQSLGLGKKEKHEGHELWIKCMAKDPVAWQTMEKYNKQDVVLLEKVYHKFLPWIRTGINLSMYSRTGQCCPNCGSTSFQSKGYRTTRTTKYQRFVCNDCGTNFRNTKSVKDKDHQTFVQI